MTTSEYTVLFANRQFVPVIPEPQLHLTPVRWSAAAVGGPKVAEIEVTGPRRDLEALTDWLRYEVKLISQRGSLLWWGYVHEVELQVGQLLVTVSLDTVINKAAVLYTALEGAAEEAFTTAWAAHAASVAEYGTREKLPSIGQASAAMATSLRDKLLARQAYPRAGRALAGSAGSRAVLRCRGWYQTLAWRYFQRTDGRVEHMPTAQVYDQPIGWGIAGSTSIGFGVAGLHDAGGRLGAFEAGHKLSVTGAADGGNNKTYTVAGPTSEAVEAITQTTIKFEESDDILDTTWKSLGFVKADHWLRVQGSAANSRWHFVGNTGESHVRTSASVSGLIEDEAAGPSITLTLAQKLTTVEANGSSEAPGAGTVTITHRGHQVAQSMVVPTAMAVNRVQLVAGRVGAPADFLTVEIYSDSAGSPGSLLTSGSLQGSLLTADEVDNVWVPVSLVTLAAGPYWLVVRRSGTLSGSDYYLLSMAAAIYGTCRQWTGTTWETHAPGWYVRFRLWAVEDVGKMLETMLASGLEFLTLNPGFLAGVDGYPTMDQAAVILDELERLLAVGTATGGRILVEVSPDRVLRLTNQAAASVTSNLLLYTAGAALRLTDAAGSDWEPGDLPVGAWVEFPDLGSNLAALGELSPAFVEEVEFDAAAGAWRFTWEGERTVADLLKVQVG